jgi:hypothetical protein
VPWAGDARAVDQGALVAVLAGHPSGPAPTGLSGADLVWQEVDGSAGLRMLAVFQSHRSGSTGPLGDLRGPDVPLLKVLHPGVLYDTTFPQVLSTARSAGLVDVPPSGGTAAAYGTTTGGRSVDLARAASLATLPNVPSGFLTYAASPSDELASLGVTPVRSATVDIAGASAQRWTYDAGGRRWLLQSASTGSVAAANVVVQTVTYRATSRKHPDGSPVLAPRVLGRGNCSVLSRGLQAPCLWSKTSDTATPVYTDQSNVPLRFEPGPTWVLLVPDNSRVQGES